MKDRVLLYGATGASGQAIAAALSDLGPRLVLGGRTPAKLLPLARRLGIEPRVLSADATMADGLADVGLVVNAAGPFVRTAEPVIEACLATGADYADITGEWPVFAHAEARDADATARNIMLLPGIGFAIAATDCLLALTVARFPDTVRLRLGLSRPHALSSGSLATLWAMNDSVVRIRRDGGLRTLPAASRYRSFDFGSGFERAVAVSWPDVVTVARSTGVQALDVYSAVGATGEAAIRIGALFAPLVRAAADTWPAAAGVSVGEASPPPRSADGLIVVAEGIDRWRRARRLSMRTLDGYAVTMLTATATVRAWLRGVRRAGFQTPSRLLGPQFVLDCGAARLIEPA